MKKNILIILFTIMVLFFLNSCNKTEKEQDYTETEENKNPLVDEHASGQMSFTTETQVTESISNDSDHSSTDIPYQIKEDKYQVEDYILIIYPQVAALEDTDLQNKINEMIKQEALLYVKDFEEDEIKGNLEVNYVITWQSNHLLSIQMIGCRNSHYTAYPTDYIHTLNINMTTGKKILLSELFHVNDEFILRLKDKSEIQLYYYSSNNKLMKDQYFNDPANRSIIIDYIFGKESYYNFNEADKNNSGIYTYLTKDSLGISFETINVMGDHIELEIIYDDILEFMNEENEVWNDFPDK